MIKINDENRIQIIDQYVNKILEDLTFEMPRHTFYHYAASFLHDKTMRLSNGAMEAEILEKYPELLESFNGKIKIDDKNYTEVRIQYVNILTTEIMEETPKFKLYDYSMRFLLQEKTLLSNEQLEAEVLEKYSFLLDENNE
jgi:hypothetical protein